VSIEKLYAVKNDEGKYWEFGDLNDFWDLGSVSCPTNTSKKQAEIVVDNHGDCEKEEVTDDDIR
jgi:hypothetical protein